jgi:hypothetical protein
VFLVSFRGFRVGCSRRDPSSRAPLLDSDRRAEGLSSSKTSPRLRRPLRHTRHCTAWRTTPPVCFLSPVFHKHRRFFTNAAGFSIDLSRFVSGSSSQRTTPRHGSRSLAPISAPLDFTCLAQRAARRRSIAPRFSSRHSSRSAGLPRYPCLEFRCFVRTEFSHSSRVGSSSVCRGSHDLVLPMRRRNP